MSQITPEEVLDLVAKQAQMCRENNDSDMRNILNFVRGMRTLIAAGKTAEEIRAYFSDDEDDEDDSSGATKETT